MDSKEVRNYLTWVAADGGPFDLVVTENLARYPVPISEFIASDIYLGQKNAYPVIVEALEEIYHPEVEGLGPIRIGTPYREILLTGSLGCGKTYAAEYAMHGVWLLVVLVQMNNGNDGHSVFFRQLGQWGENAADFAVFVGVRFAHVCRDGVDDDQPGFGELLQNGAKVLDVPLQVERLDLPTAFGL